MSDVDTGAAAPEPAFTPITIEGDKTFISPSSAARALAQARHAKRPDADTGNSAAAPAAPDPEPEQNSAQADDAAPPDAEATGQATEEANPEPAKEPPLERPRSWSKEKAEIWSKLDRAAQEYLLEHDSNTSSAVRKAQNEAAEQRKAIEAEREAVAQARQQYESALPILLQSLTASYSQEFADIRTMDDVQRLATEDPLRYTKWDAQQKRLAGIQQEIIASQGRQSAEKQQRLSEFIRRETELFAEKVPEIADETQRGKLQSAAVSVLRDLGFKDDELGRYWRGESDLSIHDHRVQLLIRDAIQLREAREKAKQVVAAPKPPVQRPGVSKPKGADAEAQVQALTKQLEAASGVKALRIATQLSQARRQMAR